MKVMDLCNKAHKNAKKKGFWDIDRELGTSLMLIVSELGEALESDRTDMYADIDEFMHAITEYPEKFDEFFALYIKDTLEDELADVFIRLGDLCKKLNINIEKHIYLKMKYNQGRPERHGKSY